MSAMIQFQNVSKCYPDDIIAVQDINLTIEQGEYVFLSGPSGAGKSTLLKMIAAIERPDTGTLTVNGQEIGQLRPAGIPFLRRNLGLILQQQHLLEDRTILENVMLPLNVTGVEQTEISCPCSAGESRTVKPCRLTSTCPIRRRTATCRRRTCDRQPPPDHSG